MVSRSTLRIAWRNLGRNRKRTILALSAIAVGQLAFLSVAALMRGFGEQYLDSITGPMVGHIQIHAPRWRDDRSIDVTLRHVSATIAEVLQDPDVERASPRIYAPALAALEVEGFMSVVVGIDPAAESHPRGLVPGEHLSGQLGEHRVLVGAALAQKQTIEPGMEIAIVGQDVDGSIANDLFTVSGVIPSAIDIVHSQGIVMSLEDAQELFLMPDQAHEIVIHLSNPDRIGDVVARLSSLLLLRDAEVLPWQEILPQFVSILKLMEGYIFVVLFIVFLAAAAGIANTMLMSTFERTHEFGMLLSLGCGPGRLSRIIATEALLLGLVGVSIGTALGVGLVALTSGSGIDYAALGGSASSYEAAFAGITMSSHTFPKTYVSDVAVGVIAVLLTSLLSVTWPVLHIVRLEPMEAMRS
jgi:putative ABC transport system permease protein